MAQLFVSHSSADNAFAARLREVLGDLGYESVFLDFDAHDGLVPGQAWRDQLFTNINAADAVLVVTTPESNASKWCHSELALARWLRKPLLSLLLDDCDPHELAADLQGVELASTAIDAERVGAALEALGLDQAARWDASRSPFPGLRAFDESYAAVFFGRDRQIDELRQLVDPPSRAREGAIIPVLGPSGSGKSSLVRAGLVPALRPNPEWVISEPWTPSDGPLAEMSLALSRAAKAQGTELDPARCTELLKTAGGMADFLRELRGSTSLGSDAKVLVVMDQAEELVTMTPEAERREFLEALTRSCTAPSPLRVVMTARTDMWDQVAAETARFTMAVAPTALHVTPLSRTDLAEIITEPAKRSHLTLEDGLVERLVEDTGTGDALPLLAFTLNRMAADASDGRLTHAAYDAIGGVQGAIASRAAEVAHGGRTESEVGEAILHLVNLGEAKPYKRLARADQVPARHKEILDDLVDARLVVASEVNGHDVYAPAHEALFRAWPPLVELIEVRRDDLRLRGRLERRAADWRDAGATGSGLLSGLELDQARDWLTRNADLGDADVRAYVDASTSRQRRGLVLRTSVGALVAALAITLVVVLLVNSHNNEQRAVEARVGELAAIAERELVHDPPAAAVALLEGMEIDAEHDELQRVAHELLASPALDVYRDLPGTSYVGLDAGGSSVAVTGTSGLIVWDTRTIPFVSETRAVTPAIRRDDEVAVISDDVRLTLYDVTTDEPRSLSTFGGRSGALAFSPDGTLLASASGNTIRLWDVRDPVEPVEIASKQTAGASVPAVNVRDDGRVYFSDTTAMLQLWDARRDGSVTKIVAFPPGDSIIQRIDIDDAEERAMVVTPVGGAGIRLVDLETGGTLGTYSGKDPELPANTPSITWSAGMSNDGRLVAAFDINGTGFAHDTSQASPPIRLTGHTSIVVLARFLADGHLVTAGIDGTLRLWDPLAPTREIKGDVTERMLCETFGARIDQDSWALAMEDQELDPPCPEQP